MYSKERRGRKEGGGEVREGRGWRRGEVRKGRGTGA